MLPPYQNDVCQTVVRRMVQLAQGSHPALVAVTTHYCI